MKQIMEKIGKFDEIEKSLQFLSDKFDQLYKDHEASMQEHANLVTENKSLKSQVLGSNNDIKSLNKTVNDLEQYSRRDYVEIRGVPYTEEESADEIVEKIGELINVEIEEGDISINHRLSDGAIT